LAKLIKIKPLWILLRSGSFIVGWGLSPAAFFAIVFRHGGSKPPPYDFSKKKSQPQILLNLRLRYGTA